MGVAKKKKKSKNKKVKVNVDVEQKDKEIIKSESNIHEDPAKDVENCLEKEPQKDDWSCICRYCNAKKHSWNMMLGRDPDNITVKSINDSTKPDLWFLAGDGMNGKFNLDESRKKITRRTDNINNMELLFELEAKESKILYHKQIIKELKEMENLGLGLLFPESYSN